MNSTARKVGATSLEELLNGHSSFVRVCMKGLGADQACALMFNGATAMGQDVDSHSKVLL